MEAAGSGPRIRTARVVVNSHASPPRGVHRNNWWSNGVTLPARRSCKDHLHPCACPLVPGRGFEPRSPVLQTGAVTRSAFRATRELVRTPVIETGPSEWRSETRPSSYIRVSIAFSSDVDSVRAKKTRQLKWWEVDGIEPPAAKGRRLQGRDGTSRPYWHFPRVGCGPANRR